MQEVYETNWVNTKKTAVALGYFDGIHIGHQFLIKQMEQYAQVHNFDKAVFTFTKTVVLGHKGKDILSVRQKINILKNMGIDLFYSPDFLEFSSLTPQQFVDDVLINSMGAKAVFCGENFLFGKNRSGNIEILKELCGKRNVKVFIVPTVELDGITVSSTEIRKALTDGDMEKANRMLGRPYSVDLEVVHGKKLGRTLGTPTINQIYPNSMCTPKEGVYITSAVVDGKRYAAATGFGNRPTVNGESLSCETTLANFSGDLYNKNIQVEFYKYLYPTRKFENVQQLKEMIEDALKASVDYF